MNLPDLITTDDNKTLEPAYFWSAAIIAVFLFLSVASFFTGKAFDYQAYGIGAGGVLGGLGAAAKFGR